MIDYNIKKIAETKDINLALFEQREGAFRTIVGDRAFKKIDKLYASIPVFYRGVEIIANAVASMPYDIVNIATNDIWNPQMQEDPPAMLPWLDELYQYLWYTATAVTLTGAAYFERETRNLMPTALIWRVPDSITPQFDKETGELTGFKRMEPNGQPIMLEPDDLVYFWGLDHTVETGEPEITPARAISTVAKVLAGIQAFMSKYFKRGLVKNYLLKYDKPLKDHESRRVKEWWSRVLSGVKSAFSAQVVRSDMEIEEVGEGLENLKEGDIAESQKWDVLIGLGVPISLVFPSAANMATREQDQISFTETTILPLFNKVLLPALNTQLFNPLGFRMVTRHKRLEVFEKSEAAKALNLVRLVRDGLLTNTEAREQLGLQPIVADAGGTLSLVELERAEILSRLIGTIFTQEEVRQQLGLSGSIPAPIAPVPEPAPEPTEPEPDRVEAEMRALNNFIRHGNHKKRAFQSDILTPAQIQAVIDEVDPPKDELKELKEKVVAALETFGEAMAEHERQPVKEDRDMNIFIPEPTVEFNPTIVVPDIKMPEIKQGEIVVNVPAQDVPQVVVNVPEQAAPVVNVENNVEFPSRASEVTTVKRDQRGLITGTESDVVWRISR